MSTNDYDGRTDETRGPELLLRLITVVRGPVTPVRRCRRRDLVGSTTVRRLPGLSRGGHVGGVGGKTMGTPGDGGFDQETEVSESVEETQSLVDDGSPRVSPRPPPVQVRPVVETSTRTVVPVADAPRPSIHRVGVTRRKVVPTGSFFLTPTH